MSGLSDHELMELVKNDDREAFTELAERWRGRAERFAFGYLKSTALSEETVQDCFVSLWLNRRLYRPDFAFGTYFLTLVKRRAYDVLKKENRSVVFEKEPDIADEKNDPSAVIESIEHRDRIMSEIKRLSEKDGGCFYLFAVRGMRTADIAKALGLSEANVRVRIHRTREKLKRLIKKEDIYGA